MVLACGFFERLDVEVPGDLDHLAVHGDDARGCVHLSYGEGGQLTPAQPGAGGGGAPSARRGARAARRRECLAEPSDITVAGDLGGVDPER